MKTEILYKIKPKQGYNFNSLLLLDENKIAVFSSKYKSDSFLHVFSKGKIIQELNLSTIKNFNSSNYYKSYFVLGNEIGIMHYAKELILFDKNNISKYELIRIQNPYKPDWAGRNISTTQSVLLKQKNQVLFALDDYFYSRSPRYLAKLRIIEKQFLGLYKRRVGKWSNLFGLPIENFPETELYKFNSNKDWLNIRSFYVTDSSIFVHTTGGSSTRMKSGNPFEFSLIGEFDHSYNWRKNHSVFEGIGNINSTNDIFLLKMRKRRNKVILYDSIDLTIKDEISLTPKQNLGDEKIMNLKFDLVGDTFYLGNHRFINICKIIK